jgi:8-oxo-dGTP pyrophosphatase MutT (NUDIX family)
MENLLFNEEIYRHDKKSINFNTGKIILRNAVRAIIIKDKSILMVHLGKTNEYKFPGGGIEENESFEEALKREVLEEIGFSVIKILKKVGIITEYAIAIEDKENVFKMISEYYSVNIDDNRIEQKLDEYESALEYKPCWIGIEDAFKINKEIIDSKCDSTPWIKRETRVLNILNEYNKIDGVRHYFV